MEGEAVLGIGRPSVSSSRVTNSRRVGACGWAGGVVHGGGWDVLGCPGGGGQQSGQVVDRDQRQAGPAVFRQRRYVLLEFGDGGDEPSVAGAVHERWSEYCAAVGGYGLLGL